MRAGIPHPDEIATSQGGDIGLGSIKGKGVEMGNKSSEGEYKMPSTSSHYPGHVGRT